LTKRDPMENDIVALKKTQDEHRHLIAIMRTSHDAIIGKDRNGIITSWNPGAELVFGYTADEIIGKPITLLFPADRLDEERAIEQAVLVEGGSVQRYETVRMRKDGTLVDVSLTISPILNEKGEIIGASKFAHDITDRKKAELEIRELNRTLESRIAERSDALIQSEKRYHDALDKMMEGVQIIDRDWRYIYVNDAVVAQSTFTREELLGHTMMEKYPGVEKTALFGVLEKCMTERCARTMENEFVFPDGSKGVFQLSIQPMSDGLFILSSDITEKKKAEEAVRLSEERFHNALDSMMEGVTILGHDWRYLYINDTALSRTTFTREEMLGHTIMERYPGIEQTPVFRQLERCMSERVAESTETEFTFPNGETKRFALKIHPATDGLFIVSADITEKWRTEEALRISEKRYYHALDSMMEGVSIIGFDWRYVYVNMTTASRTEYEREELIGRSLLEVYPGIEKNPQFNVLQECMTERVARKVEIEFKFPNGNVVCFDMSVQPAIDGIFILSTDITDRRRSERELEIYRQQLKRQNVELEQFAYIASHDLQEPLRMVSSYVQLLERRYRDKLDSDANEFIEFAVDGTVRMKQLINDLLSYSLLGRPVTFEEVDMRTVVDQVRANLMTAIAESGAVVTSTELPILRACQTEMIQVMQNLIGNAVKFRQTAIPPEIQITYRAEGDDHLFAVTDNGIGIDEEYKEKVFFPFKRLHDRWKYSGSGIGLAVVQKIIQRYGGKVWFTSEQGKGTTFFFTIKSIGV
jgi:PAS domain S-box-containing protein